MKDLKRGSVVMMKAGSGVPGYGNEQCVSSVCGPLGTIDLFGHNQHYQFYDIAQIIEQAEVAGVAELRGDLAAMTRDFEDAVRGGEALATEVAELREALQFVRSPALETYVHMDSLGERCACGACSRQRAERVLEGF